MNNFFYIRLEDTPETIVEAVRTDNQDKNASIFGSQRVGQRLKVSLENTTCPTLH